MVTLAGSQVWWTWETEDSFRQVQEGDKHAMKTYAAKLTQQLGQLTGMVSGILRNARARCSGVGLLPKSASEHRWRSAVQVRSDLSGDTRRKVNTLIITDVHARDIIDKFVRDSIMDAREFAWESQLRFYWDRTLVSP